MKVKHKLLSDFQYISPDKKIFVLKSGTILEEYNYKVKGEVIPVDRDIVDNNPEFFEAVDWKAELLSFMRVNKMPQPAQLGKKLIPFIEEMVLSAVTPQAAAPADLERREAEAIRKLGEVERQRLELDQKIQESETRSRIVQRQEIALREDSAAFESKEEALRQRQKSLLEKELQLDDREQAVREKERNVEGLALKSMDDMDSKYADLQARIERDLQEVSRKEREVELRQAEVEEAARALDASMASEALQSLRTAVRDLASFGGMHVDLDALIGRILEADARLD